MKRDRLAALLLAVLLFLAGSHGEAEANAFPSIWKGRGKTVALTFDDGPRPGFVEPILQILREKRVKATFFVVGQSAAQHPELIRAIAADGHVLGNHSYYHNNITLLPRENAGLEWRLCSEALERILGARPRFARAPGGQSNPFVAGKAAEEGLRLVLWTNNPGDYRDRISPSALSKKVLGRSSPGDIVLLHVGVVSTIRALPDIIDGYRARGFRFVTVEEI